MGLNRARIAAALFSTAIATVSFAELIGVGDELSSPVIVYDSQGTTSYDAASNLFSVDAICLTLALIRVTLALRGTSICPSM